MRLITAGKLMVINSGNDTDDDDDDDDDNYQL